jgi:ABC-type multidrug transport system fused ATPase/permease subunit
MNGLRAVVSFRREDRNRDIFGALNDENAQANGDGLVALAVYTPTVRLLGNLSLVATMVLGAVQVIDGTLEIGVLAAFLLYVRRMYDPLDELAMFYNAYQGAIAALEKISGLLEEVPGVPEPASAQPLPERIAGDVRFADVAFAYTPEVPVLAPLDLHIPAGQTVAVVGATGAGKSTLAKLLARFYDPSVGTVLLDDVDVATVAAADLRRGVIMVTQESFLFSGSVADNIALGRPTATRAQIEAAADAIGAGEFIRSLPEGFDTDVRKRGGRLSAGQRQLVAFARAFLADPAVLILDEATASLDLPAERAVQRALGTVLDTGCPRWPSPTGCWCWTAAGSSRTVRRRTCSPAPAPSPPCTRPGATPWSEPAYRHGRGVSARLGRGRGGHLDAGAQPGLVQDVRDV